MEPIEIDKADASSRSFGEPSQFPLLTSAQTTSAALRRLMDEVRCDPETSSSASMAYNRQHNRHNR